MYIILSGTEGVGKSHAANIIELIHNEKKQNIIKTHEAGGTVIAEAIRNVLLHTDTDEMYYPMSELLLFYAARNQLYRNVIMPALNENTTVLSDRSFLCSYAYQIKSRKMIDESVFWNIHNLVLSDAPMPNLIIHLYTNTVEEGLKRAHNRGKPDRIERNSIDFFEQAELGYREIINKIKDKVDNTLFINTSELSEKQVELKIRAYFKEKYEI